MFLRYSFPLESNKGFVTTSFLLDSGAPGSSLYLSAKTKKELIKHRIIKEQKTQRYLMVNGKQIFIQNTPKAQQISDILPFSLWSLFGVTTSLEGQQSQESQHKSTTESEQPQNTREGKDAVPIQESKGSVEERRKSQDKVLEQALQDQSSEVCESRVHIPISSGSATQKVPVTPIQPTEGQKLKSSQPQQKSKRRKSLQQKSNVDFSKVSVDQLSDQLEQPKFG
eukprot:TRINITY_DN2670_c0_g1_i2.p1 TRINITY_DN2670_c0_g1~~TRINITY_DN2670_c0_g1_i2.p1  ORF type:complete len:225 (+),score=34.48 TRINITY_DN2670_c0_g1_i2:334-1008(+)